MEFKQTEKQREATVLLSGTAKNNMLFGGSRSGKTFEIVKNIIIRCCKRKSRAISFRKTFNHIKTSIWMDTLPKVLELKFPNLEVQWNKSDYYLKFPNGSEYWMGGLDEKARVEKHLGKEFSTIHFNECSEIVRESIDMMKTRLAENSGLLNKIYYDMNPPTKKHWSYWQFVKHWDDYAECELDPADYVSLLMNPGDNLENLPDDYIKILQGMPENMRKRFLNGEFVDSDDGEAYYEFDRDRHSKSTIKKPGTIFCGMDFNVNPMTGAIFQVVNNEFHVIDEIYLPNSDTYKMAGELIKKGYRGATVIPDSTAKNRKTSGKSDINILKEYGFTVMATHNPLQRDRVNNANRLLAADRIKINPKCKKLINDLEKVSWLNDKLDQKTDPSLTHISDAFTYGLWKLDPIQSNSKAKIRIY